jgi:hypothetical protein
MVASVYRHQQYKDRVATLEDDRVSFMLPTDEP